MRLCHRLYPLLPSLPLFIEVPANARVRAVNESQRGGRKCFKSFNQRSVCQRLTSDFLRCSGKPQMQKIS